MPKSLLPRVADLEYMHRDMPTRFDIYDLQRSVDKFVGVEMPDHSDLQEEVKNLSDQVEVLSRAVADLTKTVERLSGRV